MRRTSFEPFHCSLARSLEVMGDWWVPLILRDLHLGLGRFDDLVEDLGISRNLLTRRLGELVDNGLVERERYLERPPRDRYVLTEAGSQLVPLLMALTAWGDQWVPPEGGPPVRFFHERCGHRFVPTVSCSVCGEAVEAAEVSPVPGPGGRVAPGTMRVPERVLALDRQARRERRRATDR